MIEEIARAPSSGLREPGVAQGRARRADDRRHDEHGHPVRWCPMCEEYRSPAAFRPSTRNRDRLTIHCVRCIARRKSDTSGRSLTRAERVALEKRDRMTDPADVDRLDRRQRRCELTRLGRPGVRKLRAKLAAVKALKAAVGGRALSVEEIDRAIRTTGEDDDAGDRETGAGPAGGRGRGEVS